MTDSSAANVNLRTLRSFVTLGEELHFTRAAARLHISQPALSKQISQLERDLRVELVRRGNRRVELTNAGEALLAEARTVLQSWNNAMAVTREAVAGDLRTLRVGFIANAAGDLTTPIVRGFTERCPSWRVQMAQGPWDDSTAGLLSGDCDVAFLRIPVDNMDQLHLRVVLTEPRWVAMAADHPLAEREVVRFEELLDEPFIAVPKSTGIWRDYWLAMNERAGHPVVIGAEVRSSDEWMEALANGFGVTFTAASTARFYHRPGVVCRPVDRISPTEVAVAWRRSDQRPVVREFVEVCTEVTSQALTG